MTDPVSVTQLLPCPNPWCDHSDPVVELTLRFMGLGSPRYVECGCGMRGPVKPTETEAITAWNTRPTPDTRPPAAAGSVREAAETIIAWLEAEQTRLNGEDYLMDTADCIAVIRERVAAAPTPDAAASEAGEVERLREALTPSADTKAAYIGEIKHSYVEWDEFGDERTVTRSVEWTTIKEVMAMIRARAALTTQGGAEG